MAAKDWRSGSDKAGWRGGAKGAPEGGRRPGAKAGGWTKRKERQHERAESRYRLRLVGGLLLAAALIVGFVVYLIFIPVRTPLLVVAVTDYDPPVPPNAWAEEDAERLAALDERETVKYSLVSWESTEQGLHNLRQQLDGAKPGGPGKDLVIIYLSMHGVVDGRGEPCLLPPGASPRKSEQWLRLRDLLDHLFVKQRPNKLPDATKKLLILDSSRMDTNWGLGLLYNSFAERLGAVVEAAGVPNLMVLNSAGPGEVGYAAPELQGSVFAYFLWQGLQGAADSEQTGNDDGKVTLQELAAYLKAQVGQWVIENRSDVQQPMLVPREADCPLVFARSDAATSLPDVQIQSDPRWNEVRSLWRRHQELAEAVPYRLDALGWEVFQRKLLRLEQLLLAGKAYADEFSQTRGELRTLASSLPEDPLPQNMAAYSLPLAQRLRAGLDIEDRRKELLAYLASAPPEAGDDTTSPPPDEPAPSASDSQDSDEKPENGADSPESQAPSRSKTKQEPAKEAAQQEAKSTPAGQESPVELKRPYGYLAAASAAWQHVLDNPFQERLPRVLALVDGAARQLETDVIELHFLRMLQAHLDWPAASDHLRAALLARDAAERAAAPSDERAQYWIRQLVEQADAKRRLAEDKLFLGSADSLQEAEQAWAQVAGSDGNGGEYQAAVDRAEQVAAAFRLRDRAWAELPYLAQWVLARLHQETGAQTDDLRELIEGTHELSEQLDTCLDGGQWSGQLEEAEARVREKLARLEKAFAERCYQLRVTAGEDKRTLQAIAVVLDLPLVTGEHRNQLRDKFLRIAASKTDTEGTRRQLGSAKAATEKASPTPQTAAPAPYLDRLAQWDPHPALAILDRARLEAQGQPGSRAAAGSPRSSNRPEAESSDILARENLLKTLWQQGDEVRGLLEDTRVDAETWLAETDRRLAVEEKLRESAASVRAGRSRADRLARASAPLLDDWLWGRPEDDPVHQLRRLDLHYLLLWHTRRTLDDFWGPTPGSRTPFFQIASRHYLQSARELCPNVSALRLGQWALPELLALREGAAAEAVRPEAPDLTVVEEETLLAHSVSVTTAQDQPPGEAAVFLQGPDGRLLEVRLDDGQKRRRMKAVVEGGDAPQQLNCWIPNDHRLVGASYGEAVALYRGHVYRRAFAVVQAAASVDIVYTRPVYPKPKVTVYGEARQPGTVMFILDCSGSMSRLLGGREGSPRRIDVARDTLEAVLLRLVRPQNPYRVGLRIYGHRAGWNPRNPNEVITRPAGLDLHPSEDVELVLAPGRFSEIERKAVGGNLDALRPMGETPLYLSIVQAIGDLRSAPQAEQRRIVAITDGFNNQSRGGRQGTRKFRIDVEDELKRPGNQGIRLDIVGFDLAATDAQEKRNLQDLVDLARQTGGAFHLAKDPTSLLQALERSLALSRYVVVPADGPAAPTPEPTDLGTTWVVDDPRDRTVAYAVRLVDTDRPARTEVKLAGGEAIELFLQDDPATGQRHLVHHRYEEGLRDERNNLRDPADTSRQVYVGAHLPEWQGKAVRFPISVQNADAEQFSPRPVEAWVRIVPRDINDAPVYVFYDSSFEPERPVPVLSCLAPNWPVEATTASIQLWLKFQKTPPDREIAVGRFQQERLQLDGAPGVTFELEARRGPEPSDPLQLIVIERHPAGADLHTVKVEISPPADAVIHRFNADAGIVRHTFVFERATPAEIADCRLLFTTRQSLIDRAIAVDQPLEVTIPRAVVSVKR